jgi:hypothetical protein
VAWATLWILEGRRRGRLSASTPAGEDLA